RFLLSSYQSSLQCGFVGEQQCCGGVKCYRRLPTRAICNKTGLGTDGSNERRADSFDPSHCSRGTMNTVLLYDSPGATLHGDRAKVSRDGSTNSAATTKRLECNSV
ncbi:hypothetical protein J4Q44_G00242120, partial [Coregonus suidteri]